MRQKATLGALIKNILAKKTEDKYVTSRVENFVFHNSGIGGGDCYRVCPQISQGDENYNRLGDSIKPKYLTITGVASIPRSQGINNAAILVDVFCLTMKEAKSWSNVNATFGSRVDAFLRLNDEGGTPTKSYDGSIMDPMYKVNDKLFRTLAHKRFQLNPIQVQPFTAGQVSVEEAGHVAKRFTMKIKCPATLDYDTAGVDPTNWAPFISVGYSYIDGSPPDALTTTRVLMNVVSHLHYSDF